MHTLVRTTPFGLRVRPRAFDRTFDDLVDSFFGPTRTRSAPPVRSSPRPGRTAP